MTTSTIQTAAHTALLDVHTGNGLLILPDDADDVTLPGEVVSLHAADWDAMIRTLYREGWEPSGNEYGEQVPHCELPDGRLVIALFGRDPISPDLPIEAHAEAWATLDAELRNVVG